MATDFRSGDFPRAGRDELDGFMWLKRVFDKARASAAGTIYDYIYPCPMDRGVIERWGLSVQAFEDALQRHAGDEELYAWLAANVSSEKIREANRWLVEERKENLDRQDSEEGVPAGRS